jgi:hypothetical protein
MMAKNPRWWFAVFLITAFFVSVGARLPAVAQAGQKDLQKLTVGYTPHFWRDATILHRC